MDDEMGRLYEHQTLMAVSIYSFLDNILSNTRRRPSGAQPQEELVPPQEPAGPTKEAAAAGGYAEDIFIFLSDTEKEELQCSVCYNILKDAHQCRNSHLFCYTCAYAWATSTSGGASCCPMCRCDGLYARNDKINERVGRKRVKCQMSNCNWRGVLRLFDDHEHRQYESAEIGLSTSSLPSISAPNAAPSPPSKVRISSIQTTNQSTSEFLRSFPAEAERPETPNAHVPTPPVPRRSSVPSTTPTTATPPVRRNSGPRRIVGTLANSNTTQGSTAETGGSSVQRRPSISSTTSAVENMPTTRQGMVPRPPGQPRPARPGQNTGVTQANRPVVVRRPSGTVPSGAATSTATTANSAATMSTSAATAVTTANPAATMSTSAATAVTTANSAATMSTSAVTAVTTANSAATMSTSAATTITSAATGTIAGASATEAASVLFTSTPSRASTPLASVLTASAGSNPRPLLNRERLTNGSLVSPSSQPLEYRRLAPVRQAVVAVADRRRAGRDQLALMLTLMSMELEDRRRNIENHAAANLERERVRIQEIAEVHTLNRRLSMVANNLERLMDGGPSASTQPTPRGRFQNSSMTIFTDSSSDDDE